MRRTKLVLAAAALMVAMLVAFAAPAMANNQNERNDQHRFSNIFDDNCCRGHDHDGNFRNNCCNNNNDKFEDIFDDNAFLFFPFFAIEEIDIDCDGVDDDWDGGIDEGADCEVEIEFFEWWD
jgi:CDP-diacylglycerol pyrophosphatase